MSGDPSRVTVKILEKEYHVTCPAEERAALVDSAEYLNRKMREIRDSGKVIGLDRIAVMAALAAWCEGFLYGIGTGSSDADIAKTEDVGEFLGDLADIAQAELEAGRSDAAGEGDFMELFEFVRAGAQLAYDELAGARAHAAG